jgi:nucleoside-diphosphate-sugar epimerase
MGHRRARGKEGVRIVITGGAGFIGSRLARRLLERGTLAGQDGRQAEIDELVLFDQAPPPAPLPPDQRVTFIAGDITDDDALACAIDRRTATVFHFAAVVSGEAEADTDKGYRVNLDGTRAVLARCRALGTTPRVIFASSLAVYGGALPPVVGDDMPLRPRTSYGAAKAMGELLVNDWSRKGYIDGRALRFPTIVIRPGRPNRAASTWASSIFREPLAGEDTVCPVGRDTMMAIMSPRRVIAAIELLHDLPGERFGDDRSLQLPAISVSVDDMVAALERAGGTRAVARIAWRPDEAIQRIVDGWPRALDAARARGLGVAPDEDIDAIVAAFIADDLALHADAR